ncbi:MAG: metal-sensitive transcriptional regulator [Gammaproteobacteria bacterium]|nr:metal-sensitive transcriptional regulator [Gammaproteobacteria bacterium]NIU52791.1 metal-sensing transcriptional repressor [Gemmatimonadota bacterium]NIR85089.1 metal-sensitive transcriptional regulator [Gammaproteobacteria bacterium]NIU06135.1 metal-sensitive transcriptional regulator [Gammaproteobacteria bacterium]NIV53082.1 metal-sensing transcriptional repressor [Gammaproteobacteria bacterium]
MNPASDDALDEPRKRELLARLGRVRGQVEGIQRMVESGRYCPDILQQSSAVHAALRAFEKLLLENHLERCVTRAIQKGGSAAAQATEEVLDLLYRYVR